ALSTNLPPMKSGWSLTTGGLTVRGLSAVAGAMCPPCPFRAGAGAGSGNAPARTSTLPAAKSDGGSDPEVDCPRAGGLPARASGTAIQLDRDNLGTRRWAAKAARIGLPGVSKGVRRLPRVRPDWTPGRMGSGAQIRAGRVELRVPGR